MGPKVSDRHVAWIYVDTVELKIKHHSAAEIESST